MIARTHREAGQALPIYITVVASLLFLAFAYFAVGQAAASRNGAQGAADAAALAAAQDARDQLRRGLLDAVLDPDTFKDLIQGKRYGTGSACSEAQRFAARNGADVVSGGCLRLPLPREGFTVEVRTQEPIGASVIPGTEKEHVKATATAVVEPRCTFEPFEEKPEDGADDDNGRGNDKPLFPGTLTCDGNIRSVDPEELDLFPDVADLFKVRLAD